jgi:hypothetical protein
LKPTSYNVAAEAKVEICPPMPGSFLFARSTIAIAFQRTRLLMRRSISWLPGNGTSWSDVSVLIYGVFAVNGSLMPRRRACSLSWTSNWPARAGPLD